MADAIPLAPYTGKLSDLERRLEEVEALHGGGGEGTSRGMETRVTKLETHMEYMRRDMGEVLGIVRELPTRRDLNAWKWQWSALAITAIGLIVGGIIGGLSWVKPDAAPPAPVIVQMPAPQMVPIAPRKP